MASDVPNSLPYRREVAKIAWAKRSCRFGVRFSKMHSADQKCRCEKRKSVENKDRVTPEVSGNHSAHRGSDQQIHRPTGFRQCVLMENLILSCSVGNVTI